MPCDLHINNGCAGLGEKNGRPDSERMPGDETFYAGISSSLFDSAACGVGCESVGLDVVAASDGTEKHTT